MKLIEQELIERIANYMKSHGTGSTPLIQVVAMIQELEGLPVKEEDDGS